ncbi:unnamed protein product [Echinostoma caproni]|uniref:G_PROTEIN_RECEP_F1_2 domain-containing protein n=1 Tax=Echinostoma caproni TaxID=27848 RepID=A0A183ACJ6_9TREM|nr:unnamed protein product [Echinostoma caproni]
MHSEQDFWNEEDSQHDLRGNVTASVQFVLLIIVLFLSLMENLFLFLVSFSSVHRWCRGRYVKRQYLDGGNSSVFPGKYPLRKGGTVSERVPPRMRNVSEHYESDGLFGNADQKSPTPPYGHSSDLDGDCRSTTTSYSSERIGNITRFYFGNLCFANLLLGLLAMPFSIAACIGTTSRPVGLQNDHNITWFSGKTEHHDNIMLKYPLVISNGMCAFIESVVCGILITTVYSLVQLTADRLLAILTPLQYPRIVTRRRALISIGIVWIASGMFVTITHLLALIPSSKPDHKLSTNAYSQTDIYRCFILGQHDEVKHWRMSITYFILVFLIPFIFIAMAYVKIYITVRRCLKQLNGEIHLKTNPTAQSCLLSSQPNDNNNNNSNIVLQQRDPNKDRINKDNQGKINRTVAQKLVMSDTYTTEQCTGDLYSQQQQQSQDNCSTLRHHRGHKMQTKAAKTACLLVSTFFSLTAPYFIFSAVEPFITITPTVMSQETQDELFETISSVIVWLLYVNSVLTPGLYALRDGVLRRRITSIWKIPGKRQTSRAPRSFIE